VAGVSSAVVSVPSTATGVSLTAVIAIVTVAVFESIVPSFALNVTVSDPVAFGLGV
jgi:hypothetical protein